MVGYNAVRTCKLIAAPALQPFYYGLTTTINQRDLERSGRNNRTYTSTGITNRTSLVAQLCIESMP